jgi:hypothetical protein
LDSEGVLSGAALSFPLVSFVGAVDGGVVGVAAVAVLSLALAFV